MTNSYTFAAIRGVQAGRAFYVAMVPLKTVSRLFRFDEDDLPPAMKAQRSLNKGRIPAIARYIADNPQTYILSALAASMDGSFRFEPANESPVFRSLGTLFVDMGATMLLNDGQHRRAGIVEALRDRATLGDETIAVTLFPDEGLERAQQMFVDLNQHSVKPARSLRLFYDHRDPGARLTHAVVTAIPLFRDLTDFARSNIPDGSRKLFAFSNLHTATMTLVEQAALSGSADNPSRVIEFWEAVIANMLEWQRVGRGELASAELRRDRIHAHGIALEAIALAGGRLVAERPNHWREALSGLQNIDWSRSNNRLWEGRAMVGGRINRSRTNVLLTADLISRSLARENAGEASELV